MNRHRLFHSWPLAVLKARDMHVQRRSTFIQLLPVAEGGICNRDGDFRSVMHVIRSDENLVYCPSIEDLSFVIHQCRQKGHIADGLLLHAFMCKIGIDSHSSLGNQLVCMGVEVGYLCWAQQIFDRLVLRSDCSWDSLINAYIKHRKVDHAFILYQKMQEKDCLCPKTHTVASLVRLCGELKDYDRGLEMHVDIVRLGILDQTLFVANALLDMYLSCALLDKAQEVFNNFTVKNVVMWTSLITGYVKVGLGEKAFHCYKEMQDSGYSPDTVTFICTLKACSTVGAARRGQEVHAEIERLGIFKKDVVVGNTLVDMYAKCGWLTKAREVLDEMPLRNVVSWTALITGCVDCGYNEEALQCSEEMQLEGVIPNSVTYIGCLRACGGSLDVEMGTKIHGEIEQRTLFKNNLAVGCALVDMYAKCGLLSRAQDIFDKLSVRNSVLWNALITGYAECGYLNNALYFLGKMQQEGFAPDASTFISMLKACGTARDIDVGSELHAAIKKRRSLECDPFIGSSLIDMYAHCGLLSKAQEVFESLSAKDVIVWNSLMTGFLENGCDEEALICYEKMQDEEIMPDPVTFVCALKACGIMKALSKGEEIHSDIARRGNLEKDSIIGNSLVDMYAKNNSLFRAKEVFDGLLCQDTVSWNSLIAGYVQHGEGEQAIDCYEQMQVKGMFPNSGTFILGLKACSSIGAMEKGQAIHVEIERKGLLQNDILLGTAVMDMYAKHGSMLLAYEVFNCLPVRNVISWNTLLTGYTSLGECEHVIELFERMLEEGVNASWVTFVIVLNACSQMGLVKQGETYYKCMSKDYGVTPSLEHQICMIDLLGRAGYVDEAFSIVKKLPSILDPSVWHSVLGACGRLGNSKVGNEVYRLARHIGRRDSSIYGLMSSIYVAGDISEETEMANLPKAPLDFLCFPSTFWWNDKYEWFSSPLFQYTV